MSEKSCLFTFYTLTPLHAGAGDSAGAIDLPVQREKHTEYPAVYSSAMKGSLREYFRRNGKSDIDEIFGKEGDERIDSASGKVIFTDAKILLFPVRSSEGVFKWVTCPFVIDRLVRDLEFIGIKKDDITVTIDDYNGIAFQTYNAAPIILEDFPVTVYDCSASSAPLLNFLKTITSPDLAENNLKKRLIIVSDDVFKTLVTTATQIIARNVLEDDTKKSNNLWYEEVVPPDAVFYTIMKPAYPGNDAITKLRGGIQNQILQIGGNETIGYGFVKWSDDLTESIGKIADTQSEETQGGEK